MEFADILDQYGIEYKPSRPGWLTVSCPWCGRPGKPGLGYSLRSGRMNCWKCGPHSAIEFLREKTRAPYAELKKLLGALDLPAIARQTHAGKLKLPTHIVDLLPAHKRYIHKQRGFDVDEIVALWKVQAIGQVGYIETDAYRIDLSWRLFIPIYHHGEMVSWTTRSINPEIQHKKYISAPESCERVPHKSILYGSDYTAHACCAVEGPIDAWRVGRGGVALCGVNYSSAQVLELSGYVVRGVCLDADAQQRAQTLASELDSFPGKTYNFVLDSKDPGSASDNEIKTIRNTLQL